MPHSPDTGYFYVPGTVRTSAFTRYGDKYMPGKRYIGGTQAAPIGAPMSGTFTALDSRTNKIAWQHKTPYRIGGGGGSTVTAGGLVFRGEPDGNFLALDAKTGEELWRFQTGFGADAPPVVYEVEGEQFVAIATGGNQLQSSSYGDAVWVFSLKGQIGPLWPPPLPQTAGIPYYYAARIHGCTVRLSSSVERARGCFGGCSKASAGGVLLSASKHSCRPDLYAPWRACAGARRRCGQSLGRRTNRGVARGSRAGRRTVRSN
jgi:outer membrane protein assembly factor BamB